MEAAFILSLLTSYKKILKNANRLLQGGFDKMHDLSPDFPVT